MGQPTGHASERLRPTFTGSGDRREAAASKRASMAASITHGRRLCNVTLLCALLTAVAAQTCAAASPHHTAARAHAKKRPHRRPTRKTSSKQPHIKPHAKPHANPPRKAAPRRVPAAHKPAAKPATEQKRITRPSQAAVAGQLTVRTCGTPPQNQTTRVAVHSALARRMEQRAQSRAAPVTVRVFFAIVQARLIERYLPHAVETICTKLEEGDVCERRRSTRY